MIRVEAKDGGMTFVVQVDDAEVLELAAELSEAIAGVYETRRLAQVDKVGLVREQIVRAGAVQVLWEVTMSGVPTEVTQKLRAWAATVHSFVKEHQDCALSGEVSS